MPITAAEARLRVRLRYSSNHQKVIDVFNTNLRKSIQDGNRSFHIKYRELNYDGNDESIILANIAKELGYSFKYDRYNDDSDGMTIAW